MMIANNRIHPEIIKQIGSNPNWLAFTKDEHTHQVLDNLALKSGIPLNCIQSGSLEEAKFVLSQNVQPQLLILDVSNQNNMIVAMKSFLRYCQPSIRIIVLGIEDHVSIYRELIQLGVKDYLTSPITEQILSEAIAKTLSNVNLLNNEETVIKVKPFTVILGARGGVGATTVAVNLASLTLQLKQKVCLIDFDLYFGNICIFLDLAQNNGLNEALVEAERLDELYIKKLLIHKENDFSVLVGQLNLDQDNKFSSEAVKNLLLLLREKFDYIYADLPPLFINPINQAILSIADNVIIIADMSLISVQDILRLRNYLHDIAPHIQYKLIINTPFPYNGKMINQPLFEKTIAMGADVQLPHCKGAMFEAINTGQPFARMYPDHAFTQNLRSFLQKMYPQLNPSKNKKESWLKLFWKS